MNKKSTTVDTDLNADVTIAIDVDAVPLPRSQDLSKTTASNISETSITRQDIMNAISGLFRSRTVVDDTINLLGADTFEKLSNKDLETDDVNFPDIHQSYELDDKPFASGGQGSISKAHDLALGCEIAVKTLHSRHAGNVRNRTEFLNEAKLTAALDHPSIIPIHGIYSDEQNGMHLAMKLIHGYTLKDYLTNVINTYTAKGIRRFDEKRSLRNRIDIFLRVCDAVEYAHNRGIVHCDLKPENIMIGKHRETYVTDWGIARHLEDAKHLGKVNGTPGYVAPEMLLKKYADQRSDIYSLGLILFEIVTLAPAFSDNDIPLLLHKVRHGMLDPLRHFFKCHIEADLKAIILKAINLDPKKRYQDVSNLAKDLRHYLANEEVSAHPDNIFAKFSRWGAAHRRGMMLSMLLLMLLGASSLTYTLTSEITRNIALHKQEQIIHSVYSDVVETANNIENQIRQIEYSLELLKLNTLFASASDKKDIKSDISFMKSLDTYRNAPPATFKYSESYHYKVDPYNVCVFNYLTGKSVEKDQLYKYSSAAEILRKQLMLLGNKNGTSEFDPEKIYEGIQPAKTFYIALKNGFFACFPAIADVPEDFRATNRTWYQEAIKNPSQVYWSKPYQDASGHKEMVTTCALAITDLSGKVIGVAAADFSLLRLGEQILSSGTRHSGYITEKMIISHDGSVIFRKSLAADGNTSEFNDAHLIKRMLTMKHGTLQFSVAFEEYMLAFSYIESLKVVYAECIDLKKLANKNNLEKN